MQRLFLYLPLCLMLFFQNCKEEENLPVLTGNEEQSTTEYSIDGQVVFTMQMIEENNEFGSSVEYETMDGTATEGVDYVKGSGTFFTGPINGFREAYITVDIINDSIKEGDEFFYIRLSNPKNLKLKTKDMKGVILDDD